MSYFSNLSSSMHFSKNSSINLLIKIQNTALYSHPQNIPFLRACLRPLLLMLRLPACLPPLCSLGWLFSMAVVCRAARSFGTPIIHIHMRQCLGSRAKALWSGGCRLLPLPPSLPSPPLPPAALPLQHIIVNTHSRPPTFDWGERRRLCCWNPRLYSARPRSLLLFTGWHFLRLHCFTTIPI